MLYQLYLDFVTEPVTYCGIGNNKSQSFHDCMRLLEKFSAFLLWLRVSKGCLVLLVFFLAAEDWDFEKQILAHCNIDIPVKQMKKRKSCAN